MRGSQGIEYSWGKSKQYFRRNSNVTIAANLHSNIVISIQQNVLPIERVWKFELKSRDYRRIYMDVAKIIADGEVDRRDVTQSGVELMH